MKLEIRNVSDRGTKEERVVLLAKEDCDIGKYLVFITRKNGESVIYTSLKEPYWFPDKVVSRGDLVILYTKKGTSSFKENKDNSKSHFYYRNLDTALLTASNFAFIIEANTWQIEKKPTP
ncbi:hypothetical protein ASE92_11925 [Pedobacter sp. Leaf41]|uniref:hypothetical protein n=1 Tax=Pedobacter sp. Leaf41 TaxID=1736218 RepID=UPI000703201D|nr:hypothetical protein [Pedobacter sp. Leaf41]KQN34312.1 hypothetical protein ASE92_11925 [Pedobacter sp. Leaf41]